MDLQRGQLFLTWIDGLVKFTSELAVGRSPSTRGHVALTQEPAIRENAPVAAGLGKFATEPWYRGAAIGAPASA